MYETIKVKVTFHTPAFLGGADQSAEWRVPPFKALLRQWWRVAVAKEHHYDHERIREAEGPLFGHAWLKNGRKVWAMRGRLTMTLDSWRPGNLRQWKADGVPAVHHPEAGRGGGGLNVNAALYLGYGPVLYDNKKRAPYIKNAPAIAAGESAGLTIRTPVEGAADVKRALGLMHLFGAAGGRSRNGWGSFALEVSEGDLRLPGRVEEARGLVDQVARPLRDCLRLPWPHAVGRAGSRPLVWATAPNADWKKVLGDLAKVKVAFRTAFPLDGVPKGSFGERHLLAYPVTNHPVKGPGWGAQGRLANQVRFKVAKDGNRYRGVVVHLPCALPDEKRRAAGRLADADEAEVWARVHAVLDERLTPLFL